MIVLGKVRDCWVLSLGPKALQEHLDAGGKAHSIEEVRRWAESEPGGYLDF
jgi:hypothetical protein